MNGFAFFSGQVPLSPQTGEVVGTTIEEQAEQVMKNIKGLLDSQNAAFTDVVKTTCFLADIADFAAFNAVYAKYFTGNPPLLRCCKGSSQGSPLRSRSDRRCIRILL